MRGEEGAEVVDSDDSYGSQEERKVPKAIRRRQALDETKYQPNDCTMVDIIERPADQTLAKVRPNKAHGMGRTKVPIHAA